MKCAESFRTSCFKSEHPTVHNVTRKKKTSVFFVKNNGLHTINTWFKAYQYSDQKICSSIVSLPMIFNGHGDVPRPRATAGAKIMRISGRRLLKLGICWATKVVGEPKLAGILTVRQDMCFHDYFFSKIKSPTIFEYLITLPSCSVSFFEISLSGNEISPPETRFPYRKLIAFSSVFISVFTSVFLGYKNLSQIPNYIPMRVFFSTLVAATVGHVTQSCKYGTAENISVIGGFESFLPHI